MKISLFLFISASLVVGHVVPSRPRPLAARAGESLTNPDEEPDYADPHSGSKIEKSRVLSGVGPDAANNRFFDWDESCTDAGQRTKIVAAFENSLQLATWTSNHLQQLQAGLPEPPGAGGRDKQGNKNFIKDKDPAYQQMFLSLDSRIQYVKETFDIFSANAVKDPAGRSDRKPGALRFICNADNHVLKGDESGPYCGDGDGAAHAITTIPWDPKYLPTIEGRYSFEKSSSITFCPRFFDALAFPTLDAVVGSDQHTLDKVECAERVLMHEYLHLSWVRNMPGTPDIIGYARSAQYAKQAGWGNLKANPDNYAWFALYAYFNNNNHGCGDDVWPPGVDKPN